MNNNITIKIELYNNEINEIDINGCKHFVYAEPQEEKEDINNMRLNEFIKHYVNWYNDLEENM